MAIFDELTTSSSTFLVIALLLVVGFEFVNGFHDSANAVATVIYTKSLNPTMAVVWSGICNLLGALLSSGTVAYSILFLLPEELVNNTASLAGFVMVFSVLIAAIIWNLATWYVGIPASSSHSLIGSILGIAIANSYLTDQWSVHWSRITPVFLSLIISPILGFCGGALLLKLLNKEPENSNGQVPPWPIRLMLITTCMGVSFAHGSNDGQKGMGLMMLVLVGILPGLFSLNMHTDPLTFTRLMISSQNAVTLINQESFLTSEQAIEELTNYLKIDSIFEYQKLYPAVSNRLDKIAHQLASRSNFNQIESDKRAQLRSDMYLVSGVIAKLERHGELEGDLQKKLLDCRQQLDRATKYIPISVKVVVALSLGLGTMIGWKRVVVTVGEKIGSQGLNYSQGGVSQVVTALTILLGDHFGLPISTTHVLSSGVAGTMFASGSQLQIKTITNIALAWILTLPVCTILSALLYVSGMYFVK